MSHEQFSLPFSPPEPSTPPAPALNVYALPPDEAFFDALAARARALYPGSDLSALRVLAPSMAVAAEFRAALARAMPEAALLPRFDTLRRWAMNAPLAGIPDPLPESERRVLLHEALRQKNWFDEAALWSIADEMAELFDALTAAEVRLPDDAEGLAEELQRAYATRASTPLAFEARIVHELWRALNAAGAPDAAAVYRLRLARLAEIAQRAAREDRDRPQPLLVLLDAAPDEALFPAERDFLRRCGEARAVHVFYPQDRASGATPILKTLAAAWPGPGPKNSASPDSARPSAPLLERAQALAADLPTGVLGGRLALVPTSGREREARAAVAQVAAWLDEGLRRIALIAQDRLTARRVRALLEREGVLVSDETGWLLSTSRAAATLDALLELAAGRACHRDLLDLCKSPFVFADMGADARRAAVSGLEAAIRAASVKSGFPRFRRALLEFDTLDSPAVALLDRAEAAAALLRSRLAPLARWLERLRAALAALGALDALAGDAVGRTLIDLLETRQGELSANGALFAFPVWRDWLDREFEAASFRDAGISSTIVVTSLQAATLRRFEAALLLGGDARQLAPASHAVFFNASARRELKLPTREDGERDLKRALAQLIAMTPRVVVTWQARREGEANLPAPELSLLSTLHQLAWGDDLLRAPLPPRGEAGANMETAPIRDRPAPAAPPELLPRRVSVSAYASLVACPYRFFARHVLALSEMDEVSEEMDKRGYGELTHRVLERFHARCPRVSALPDEEALEMLRACSDSVFAPAIADDFLATGWRLRWEKRLPDYLDWQRAREAAGWRWKKAETRVARLLPLARGECVELYGRVDRVDERVGERPGEAAAALYDYKMQTPLAIKKRLADDVQLPAYALMHDAAAEAAYVALDGDRVDTVVSSDSADALRESAGRQGERLTAAFDALLAGAPLPAHGVDSVCQWCEVRGLCRNGRE